MIKKTAGIATILLLILVIGISIVRANAQTVDLGTLDLSGVKLNEVDTVNLHELRADVRLDSNLGLLDAHDLSLKGMDKVDALASVRHLPDMDANLSKLDAGLGLLVDHLS